jgi:drug/metabolite transporter (DMT)-like permease
VTLAKLAVLLTAVALAATGQVVLKRGMSEVQHTARRNGQMLLLTAIQSPWVIGGLAIFVASAAAWLVTLAHVPLSVAYPFNAAGYVAILVVSSFVLHERTSVWMWVGTLLVGSGLVLVVLTAPRSANAPVKVPRQNTIARVVNTDDGNRP